MNKDEIIDFEQLWDSGYKCACTVGWKPSVKSFMLNQFERTLNMEESLKDGTWKNGRPKPIVIYYPKKREGLSIQFPDRVYQRSINDLALYPTMVRPFIYDNSACQKGKGPDFTIERLKRSLHNYVMKYGLDGWVTQFDVHGYYPSMNHRMVKEIFRQQLDDDVYIMVADVLDQQYEGDTGYNPGSQMVQIAGISTLNRLDHMCKEELHMGNYRRYMDDGLNIGPDREREVYNLKRIVDQLNRQGFQSNPKKTHVIPLRDGFKFLGWDWKVTEAGKVIMTLDSQNIHHERKRLYRMARKVKRGDATREKADECYNAWKSYASKGNTYKVIQRMDAYYKDLWR